mgnify:CR=1 FL=1
MVYTHVYMKNAHEKLKEFVGRAWLQTVTVKHKFISSVFRVPCYGISANIICLHFVIHWLGTRPGLLKIYSLSAATIYSTRWVIYEIGCGVN